METKRASWASRSTFILAAIGSAVGLGNAWRFPGLAAVYGGGAFLLVYLLAMLLFGIPLLMMEIAIGRKLRQGAPGAMRGIGKKFEPIGWMATSNAFFIVTYYAVVFGWVILMMFMAGISFGGLTGNSEGASVVFENTIQTSWSVTEGFGTVPTVVLVCVLIAWGLIYYCIRNGAQSVSKVVKFTVFAPIACLVIMAIKGLTMPGAMDGIRKLFIPDFSALSNVSLWIDACGQVFYSLSITMAIMFAYGSFLKEDTNIAADGMIIAFSDMAISVLSAIVMFSTMGGVGMLDSMSPSGIATAFIIYPQAIINLTDIGWLNAAFGVVFYLCLITLAIDSAFSIVEGVSTAVSDKFRLKPKTTTIAVCAIAGIISLLYCTGAGFAWLDIMDNWCNQYNLIFVGILECIAIGWCFKTGKVLKEVNRNTKKFTMPAWWFEISIKFVAPVILSGLFVWNIVKYIMNLANGDPGYGYPLWAEIIGGWVVSALVICSGFIVKLVVKHKVKNGFVEEDIVWKDEE